MLVHLKSTPLLSTKSITFVLLDTRPPNQVNYILLLCQLDKCRKIVEMREEVYANVEVDEISHT